MSSGTASTHSPPNLTLDPETGAIRLTWAPNIHYHFFERELHQTQVMSSGTASARKAMRLLLIPVDEAFRRIRTARPSIGRRMFTNYIQRVFAAVRSPVPPKQELNPVQYICPNHKALSHESRGDDSEYTQFSFAVDLA
jgi:hypothetical protein